MSERLVGIRIGMNVHWVREREIQGMRVDTLKIIKSEKNESNTEFKK